MYLKTKTGIYLRDFTKIAKFFVKSFEVPKKKQAWQLKKCLHKLLPLFSLEKEWAKSWCFKATYKIKSWSCRSNSNPQNCFQLLSCIVNIMSVSKNSSFYLSIYLYYIVSPMRMNSHLKNVNPTCNIQLFLIWEFSNPT